MACKLTTSISSTDASRSSAGLKSPNCLAENVGNLHQGPLTSGDDGSPRDCSDDERRRAAAATALVATCSSEQRIGQRFTDLGLSNDIWLNVFRYLDVVDLRNLMLVCFDFRQLVIPVLYSEVTFSEWAGRGLQFATAIEQCQISLECTRHIQHAKIYFTLLTEIMQMLILLCQIKSQLSGLRLITLVSHRFEEAIVAANMLNSHYPDVQFEIKSETIEKPCFSNQIFKSVLARLRLVRAPALLRSSLSEMCSLTDLEVKAIIHDCDHPFQTVPHRAALSHADWVAMGSPHIEKLELYLWRSEAMTLDNCLGFVASSDNLAHPSGIIEINNPALLELKLESDSHYHSAASIHLHTPSLRKLVFSNIPPSVVENTLMDSELGHLDTISLEPASVSGLRGIVNGNVPALKSLALMILPTTPFEAPCPEQVDELVSWIYRVSLTIPTNVHDYVGLVSEKLPIHDLLYCSTT